MFYQHLEIDGIFVEKNIDSSMILKIARQLGEKIPKVTLPITLYSGNVQSCQFHLFFLI